MSLCVAWKYEDRHSSRVFFAADSGVVVNTVVNEEPRTVVMPYSGIKVLEIPIRVRSATDAATGQAQQLFDRKYGMAFAGSYLTAFLLKELLAENLAKAQFVGPPESVTFERICEVALRFHRYFHGQIREHLTRDFEVDFFLGGYCGAAHKVRVARFFVDLGTEEPAYKEILAQEGFSFDTIGIETAQDRFADLMRLSLSAPCRTHFAAFRRLRDIILDPDYPLVAGVTQYGEFEGADFKLRGSLNVEVEHGDLRSRMYVRGTNLDLIRGDEGWGDLHWGYSFGDLQGDDVRSFDATRTFWEMRQQEDGSPNPVRHVIDEQITVVPHDPKWMRWFEEEAGFLRIALGADVPIEHIGSTAVPGLAAVQFIDVLVGVDALADAQHLPFNLETNGYEYLGDRLIRGQLCYRKRGERWFNLHVVERDGDFWRSALRLRDYLRQHPDECAAYSREKIRILNTGSWTLVRYLNERANYLGQLLARAGQ